MLLVEPGLPELKGEKAEGACWGLKGATTVSAFAAFARLQGRRCPLGIDAHLWVIVHSLRNSLNVRRFFNRKKREKSARMMSSTDIGFSRNCLTGDLSLQRDSNPGEAVRRFSARQQSKEVKRVGLVVAIPLTFTFHSELRDSIVVGTEVVRMGIESY